MAISRSKTLVGLGLVTVALLAYFTVMWDTTQRQPGGDPKGTVLHTMKTLGRAVPSAASNVSIEGSETHWLRACAEIANSHAGWDKASVDVRFSDPDPGALVDRQIASGLERSGWVPLRMRITKGQGVVPHWVRSVNGARPIDAFAYAVPAGSKTWFLTASWQPPGPVDQGCP